MIKIIKDFNKFRKERKEIEEIVNHAIERNDFEYFGKRPRVITPKDIRISYFELFKESVNDKYTLGGFISSTFLDGESSIPFYGVNKRGTLFVLSYTPCWINFEMSGYPFNGQIKSGIMEIGRIQTSTDGDGVSQTSLNVGDNFEYHSGYNANHDISEVIDKIQKGIIIPRIPIDVLNKIPGIKDYRLMKETHNLPSIQS